MITIENIRMRLQESIRLSGYSQSDIAQKLGISPSNISHYLRGDILPALDTLANICKIIDVSPAYILCFED